MSTRTYYGIALYRRPGTVERRWAAFTADRWLFASTLDGIKEAIREANGMGRHPNGATYEDAKPKRCEACGAQAGHEPTWGCTWPKEPTP